MKAVKQRTNCGDQHERRPEAWAARTTTEHDKRDGYAKYHCIRRLRPRAQRGGVVGSGKASRGVAVVRANMQATV